MINVSIHGGDHSPEILKVEKVSTPEEYRRVSGARGFASDANQGSYSPPPIRGRDFGTPCNGTCLWRGREFAARYKPSCIQGTRRSLGRARAALPSVTPTVFVERNPETLRRPGCVAISYNVASGAARAAGVAATRPRAFPRAIRMSFANPSDITQTAFHGSRPQINIPGRSGNRPC